MSSNPIAFRSFHELMDVSKTRVNALVLFATVLIATFGVPTFASADQPPQSPQAVVATVATVADQSTATSPYALYLTTIVTPSVMSKWNKVAWCETHRNWQSRGPIFSGGLGITNHNWAEFGGWDFAHNASQATPEQQVLIATRIQENAGVGGYVPDQYGYCSAW